MINIPNITYQVEKHWKNVHSTCLMDSTYGHLMRVYDTGNEVSKRKKEMLSIKTMFQLAECPVIKSRNCLKLNLNDDIDISSWFVFVVLFHDWKTAVTIIHLSMDSGHTSMERNWIISDS